MGGNSSKVKEDVKEPKLNTSYQNPVVPPVSIPQKKTQESLQKDT